MVELAGKNFSVTAAMETEDMKTGKNDQEKKKKKEKNNVAPIICLVPRFVDTFCCPIVRNVGSTSCNTNSHPTPPPSSPPAADVGRKQPFVAPVNWGLTTEENRGK